MNILQRIFTDYYEEIKYTLHPRKSEMENIDKMLSCGDPSFGGAMYGCPHCGNLNFPMQFQNRNTAFIVVSINGELQFLLLLVMTLWNVLHAGIKWSYLNSITTTNAYPSKNSMREPCPKLPESIPLHDFLWYNLPIERKDRIEHQYRGITQKISG